MWAWRTPTARDQVEAAFVAALYDEYGGALHAYALGFLGDPGRASDLVQEVMLKAWNHPANVHPRAGDPRAWLFAVARNLLTDWHRAQQRRPEAVTDPHALPDLPLVDDVLARALEQWQMTEALARLSADHRAVLQEVYFLGRSTVEAAAVLRIPAGTVKSRTHHALVRLRAVLLEMGVQP